MSGDAEETIRRFWEIQDSGDYTATVELFAEDALFEDPIYGTFEGRPAIGEFMAKMNAVVSKVNGRFDLLELAGGETSAWAKWRMTTDAGVRDGVGIYRVADSRITYYRDYVDPADES